MKIILMRHGKPQIHLESMRSDKKSPAETGQVIRDYKQSGLNPDQQPPRDSIKISALCAAAFSSNLPRATDSAKMLGIDKNLMIDVCFAESDHPYYKWQSPKLKFFTWCILFRVMWFFGFSQNGESIKSGRKRAQISAQKLNQSAQENGTVILLGHGIINRLIATKLKKQGWQKTQSSGHDYWSYIVLERA